jgi:CBS domain containing-hemolysin-like protein
MTALQKVPAVGDRVETEGKCFHIVEMVGQRIARVRLDPGAGDASCGEDSETGIEKKGT